jgi:hypothetical protein
MSKTKWIIERGAAKYANRRKYAIIKRPGLSLVTGFLFVSLSQFCSVAKKDSVMNECK